MPVVRNPVPIELPESVANAGDVVVVAVNAASRVTATSRHVRRTAPVPRPTATRKARRATGGALTIQLPPTAILRSAIPRGNPAKVVKAATVVVEMVVDPVPTEKTAMQRAIRASPNWVLPKVTTTRAMVRWNKQSPKRVSRHHRPVLKTVSPVKNVTATVTAANAVHVATAAIQRSVRICASPFNPPR